MNIGSPEQERDRWGHRWSDEEILRGQRQGSDGTFRNAYPMGHRHPDRKHAERIRDLLAKGHNLMQESIPVVITTLTEIIQDPDEPASARVRACEIMLERVYGKTPQQINLNVDSPFERLMMDLVLRFTGGSQAEVVDINEADGIIWDEED